MKVERMLIVLAVLSINGGCANDLLYVHDTSLGVDVSVRPDETSGRLMVGYDRDTYALIPRRKSSNNKEDDAMALTSVSCIDLDGISEFHYNQFIATGNSAVMIAKDSTAIKQIRNALFGGNKTCAP